MSAESDGDAQEARETVIDAFARATERYGLDPAYGRVFGYLYFEPDTETPAEIADAVGLNVETVEDALETLEHWRLVDRTPAGAVAERDFVTAYEELLADEVEAEVRILSGALDEAEELLAESEGPRAEADLERVEDLQEAYALGYRLLEALEAMPLETLVHLAERYVEGDLPEVEEQGLPTSRDD